MDNFIKRYVHGDLRIWIMFIGICLISVIEIYSAGSFFVNNKENHTSELFRHSMFLIMGGFLAWAVHKMPFKWVRGGGYILLFVSAFFLMVLAVIPPGALPSISIGGITLLGIAVENEAARWVVFFGVKFQPSEFAKIAVVIFLADFLTDKPERSLLITTYVNIRKKELTEKLAKKLKFNISMGVLGFFFILIAPDNLSTGVLLLAIGMILIFLSNVAFWRLLAVVLVAGTVAFGSFFLVKSLDKSTLDVVGMGRAKTWEGRINSFLGEDEETKYAYNDQTAQIVHSQIAIARGGWFGVMPGNSVERDYLPQAFADFIYAIIIEEMGFLGGFVIIALYLMFLYRAGIIAKRSQFEFPALLVLGLALMLVFQTFISVAVAVHLGPVTGQPLPLISRGGTSVLITWLYIGIIQLVARSINDAERKENPVEKAENYEVDYDIDAPEQELEIRLKEE